MKKILLNLIWMCMVTTIAKSQVATVSLTTPPCNDDGVITVNYAGFTLPVNITYTDAAKGPVIHSNINITTDQLITYTGNAMTILVSNSAGQSATTYINSPNPNFYPSAAMYAAPCPQPATGIAGVWQGGSTANYTFEWYNKATNVLAATGDTVLLPSNNDYYMKAIATGGCAVYFDSSLYAYNYNNITLQTTIVQPACTNGSITITGATGANLPVTYLWSNGTVGTSINNLSQGTYGVNVTDATGCVSNQLFSLIQNPQLIVNTTFTSPSCTNGSITVNSISNAIAPIAYTWSNGAVTNNITGLSQGLYSVNVVDANGCIGNKGIYLQQTPVITCNLVSTPATCINANGALTAFSSGGTAPYSYVWSNGATGNVLNSVVSGNYNCSITDANGCIGTGYGFITSNSPITANYSTTLSSCTAPTGSATLSVSNGTPPYTITWGTFPAQTGLVASNLPKGNYAFNITDAVGCTRFGIVSIDDNSSLITNNFITTNYVCGLVQGSIAANITGGTAPYTYAWTNGATTSAISNLVNGNYNLTITDNAGCKKYSYYYMSYQSTLNLGATTTASSCIFASDGSAQALVTGGTAPYNYSWSNAITTAINSNLVQGTYYVNVTDAAGCTDNQWVYVGTTNSNSSCYCTVQGYSFIDANGNCVKDAGEAGIANIAINNSVSGTDYTDANGFYSIKVPNGSSVLTQYANPNYPLMSCQSNSIPITSAAATGCIITQNFADSLIPKTDMHTSIVSIMPPRPGFDNNLKIVTTNLGTSTEPLAISSIKDDGQLNTATFANGYYSGSNSYYKNSIPFVIAPTQSITEYFTYNTPTNIPLGTLINHFDSTCYSAPMSNWINDYTPWNNVQQFNQYVVGSWDPNFKEVSPAGKGATGDIFTKDSILTYTVHFQNEGSYYAQNVVVLDTLDADLDWSTMRPISASHKAEVFINKNGVISYTFKNILLPAKSVEPILSNGYFQYTIKQKKNLPLGTKITNSAAIYFDFNEPVITNKTINTITAPAGIDPFVKLYSDIKVYPNPTSGDIAIDIPLTTASTASVQLYDIMGKLIKEQQSATGATLKINIKDVAAGNYLLKISCGDKVYRSKVAKQ